MVILWAPIYGSDDHARVLLDTADYERVRGHKIHVQVNKNGYRFVCIRLPSALRQEQGYAGRGLLVLSRYLLGLAKGDPTQVDHVNRIPLDNRRANLRLSTPQANVVNSSVRKDNTSGFKGVTWRKASDLWQAQVQSGGPNTTAYFKNIEDAVRWYDAKVREIHGPTATTNESLGC